MADRPKKPLILRPSQMDEAGDVVIGDFVRPIWGGMLGFVENISNGYATMLIVRNGNGHREIIEVRNLKRVAR